jgi:Holliday junction resolvase RusA-like endonuclease
VDKNVDRFCCFVPGVPRPQGSKNAVVRNGRSMMYEANPKIGVWRRAMSKAFIAQMRQYCTIKFPLDGALILHATFVFPRTKSCPKKTEPVMNVKPDLSKLMRAVEDSLEDAGVIVNDSRICVYDRPCKRYAGIDEVPGVSVIVEVMCASTVSRAGHEPDIPMAEQRGRCDVASRWPVSRR